MDKEITLCELMKIIKEKPVKATIKYTEQLICKFPLSVTFDFSKEEEEKKFYGWLMHQRDTILSRMSAHAEGIPENTDIQCMSYIELAENAFDIFCGKKQDSSTAKVYIEKEGNK